jgi:hypothetical protein
MRCLRSVVCVPPCSASSGCPRQSVGLSPSLKTPHFDKRDLMRLMMKCETALQWRPWSLGWWLLVEMARGIVTVQVGQAGNQMGHEVRSLNTSSQSISCACVHVRVSVPCTVCVWCVRNAMQGAW